MRLQGRGGDAVCEAAVYTMIGMYAVGAGVKRGGAVVLCVHLADERALHAAPRVRASPPVRKKPVLGAKSAPPVASLLFFWEVL
jgi:hypothetical protein